MQRLTHLDLPLTLHDVAVPVETIHAGARSSQPLNPAPSSRNRCLQKAVSLLSFAFVMAFASTGFTQTAHFSNTQMPIGSGLLNAGGVAVDAKGNIFIADVGNQRVVEETVTPGYSYVQSVVATGIANPRWIAVDGADNVYIADGAISQQTGNGILKETPGPAGYTSTTLFSGRSFIGLAADAAGDLYSVDLGTYYLLKLTPSGGTYTQTIVADPSHEKGSEIGGVAVDKNHSVYILDDDDTRIVRYTPSGSTYISKGLGIANGALGLAADGNGNVYFVPAGVAGGLRVVPALGGSYSVIPTSRFYAGGICHRQSRQYLPKRWNCCISRCIRRCR